MQQVSTTVIVLFAARTDGEIVPNWINQWVVWAVKEKVQHKKLVTNSAGARQMNRVEVS